MLLLIEGWVALFVVVVALGVYRHWLVRHEDDTLHLSDQTGTFVRQQAQLEKTLAQLDMAGNVLTVVLVLYACFIAGQFFYQGWLDSMKVQ